MQEGPRGGVTGDEEWAVNLRAYLGSLDDPGRAGFCEALARSYLSSSGNGLEPFGTVGLATAGYTWARQAPWEGQATRTGNDLPVLDARYAPGDVAADGTAGPGDLANAGANDGHGPVRTPLELTPVVVAGRQARPTVMDHPGHT